MADRSPSHKWACACAALLLVSARPCMADGLKKHNLGDPLFRYRTTTQDHGLYEIREEARRFLRSQPRRKTGAWVPVGPDIRAQVPLCAVPLRTRWARAADNPESLPGVLVICKKSIDNKAPSWSTFVTTYIPAEHALEMRRRYPDLPSLGVVEPK